MSKATQGEAKVKILRLDGDWFPKSVIPSQQSQRVAVAFLQSGDCYDVYLSECGHNRETSVHVPSFERALAVARAWVEHGKVVDE